MTKKQPKPIGTTCLNEIDNLSTHKPWGPKTVEDIPISAISAPKGYLFTHGSACASLPTTSPDGYEYVLDLYVFRQDGNGVDTDRYIGSISPDGSLVTLKIPHEHNPYHHLNPLDPVVTKLSPKKQKRVLEILEDRD